MLREFQNPRLNQKAYLRRNWYKREYEIVSDLKRDIEDLQECQERISRCWEVGDPVSAERELQLLVEINWDYNNHETDLFLRHCRASLYSHRIQCLPFIINYLFHWVDELNTFCIRMECI